MGIVAGLDSSPDFTRIVVCDTDTGAVLRQGYAPHPVETPEDGGTARASGAERGGGRPSDIDPQAWLLSLGEAAGGGLLEGVQAIGVSAQANALVPLDTQGATVRPALVGGDKRAQVAAADLIDALGGRQAWAEAVGCVPQAAQPVTKLRWLAKTEPDNALRTTVLMQAHDWLVWQLLGRPVRRTTDRGGASGTGYWSAATGTYRGDLVELALGHQAMVPEVIGPSDAAGTTPEGLLISAGTGETMAAALGLGIGLGDAVVSLGASGSVMAVHPEALVDSSGMITSLADATGMHLPVVTTLNAVRTLRGTAELLGLPDLESLSDLAMKSTPGSHGLVLLPYLEGERTPNLPHTAGTLAGLRRESMKPEHLARAAFEGMLCGLADALDVLRGRGVEVRRIFLLGAAAELPAVQAAAPSLFGAQVVVPQPADYAAIGAARRRPGRSASPRAPSTRAPRPRGRARRPRSWSRARSSRWARPYGSSTCRYASRRIRERSARRRADRCGRGDGDVVHLTRRHPHGDHPAVTHVTTLQNYIRRPSPLGRMTAVGLIG